MTPKLGTTKHLNKVHMNLSACPNHTKTTWIRFYVFNFFKVHLKHLKDIKFSVIYFKVLQQGYRYLNKYCSEIDFMIHESQEFAFKHP